MMWRESVSKTTVSSTANHARVRPAEGDPTRLGPEGVQRADVAVERGGVRQGLLGSQEPEGRGGAAAG